MLPFFVVPVFTSSWLPALLLQALGQSFRLRFGSGLRGFVFSDPNMSMKLATWAALREGGLGLLQGGCRSKTPGKSSSILSAMSRPRNSGPHSHLAVLKLQCAIECSSASVVVG